MAALQTQTFDGLAGGMNVAKPQHELGDDEARYLQDVLLDYPGFVRRRGPVQSFAGFPTFTEKGSGIFGTITPAGKYRMAVLTGDTVNGYFRMLSDDFTTYTTFNWTGALPGAPSANPYRIVDSRPSLSGGVWVGTSSQYNSASPIQNLALWRGGNRADYTTGTLSLTRGSATISGAGTLWAANAAPGEHLFADVTDTANTGKFTSTYIGVIKSVDSDTQMTLGAVSPYTTAATAYKLTSVRGLQYRVLKGRLVTNTGNTTVTGANTKFLSQFMDEVVASRSGSTHTNTILDALSQTSDLKVGMRVTGTNIAANSIIVSIDSSSQVTLNNATTGTATNTMTFKNTWNLYRGSDLTWIGRASLINNDISITLAANATVALNNERFIAINGTGDWSINTAATTHKVGFLTATYAGRQWFANNSNTLTNTSRVWFSETSDPEGLDLADFDGDFLDTASSVGTDTPIKAICPAYNSLVIVKENETFAITGTSPTTFELKKIQDDGCLSGMSVQPFGGGVIWAGRDGIHFYDGIQVTDLAADKLGDYYKNALRTVDPTTYRMWSMICRDHYFLFIENYSPSVAVIKGVLSTTPTAATIAINMVTGAISLMTNLGIRGFVDTPADTGKQNIYIVNDQTKANICYGFDLFDQEGQDSILCDLGSSSGKYSYGQTTLSTGTTFAGVADTKYFSKITLSARAAVETIRAYSVGQGGGAGGCNVRAGIYTDVAGVPSVLLGSSAVTALNQGDGPAFRDYTFSTPVELAAGSYWIGVQVETSSRVNFYRLGTANLTASATDAYADGLAAAFGAVTNNNGPMVVYAVVRSCGPDAFIETKKFSEGDSMRKKLLKQIAMTYIVQGDTMRLDTVPGLNTIGKTSSVSFPVTVYTWDQIVALFGSWDLLASTYGNWDQLTNANFVPKRIKFIRRSQLLSVRLWQNSPAVSRFKLGPFNLGYKWQRPGRV